MRNPGPSAGICCESPLITFVQSLRTYTLEATRDQPYNKGKDEDQSRYPDIDIEISRYTTGDSADHALICTAIETLRDI